ncbi:unnamed protein product [Withania somnifera]
MLVHWKSWWRSVYKQNHFVLKLGFSILLVGLAFRLLFARSDVISEVQETPSAQKTLSLPPSVSFSLPQIADQIGSEQAGRCNLFIGDWIPDPAGPVYTNETCKFIEDHQNCMKNGRPDNGYLYYRWKPRNCQLPRFNPHKFLQLMSNKTWALIGDSISRNHVQSFLCVLSKVEEAIEVYHDKEYRSRRWLFASYNFTVSVVWSPFLAQAAIFEDYNGVSTSEIELHLDKLDPSWTDQFKNFDYMIFASGEWYVKTTIYYENDTVLGCHYYHFENGEWFSGGSCKRTEPVKEGNFSLSEVNKILHEIELEEIGKATAKASEKGLNLKLFDVTPLSLMRPDGHPGPYRHFQPFAKDENAKVINDCLHWCLPGPIDAWNDMLMEIVLNG